MAVDDYLKCREYRDKPRSEKYPDFTVFQHSDGQYYFARTSSSDDVQFVSQGYASTGARDNGIESVIKNYGNADRYKAGTTDGGKHYLSLRAGNNQEIARTCLKNSAAEAAAYGPSGGDDAQATNSKSKEVYLRCEAYAGHPEGAESGFYEFENNGLYFFATLNRVGKVRLRSQGYRSVAARKQGIDSVKRHRDDRDNYQERTTSKQRTYFSLRAGNGQEIARTCPNADRGEALKMLPSGRKGDESGSKQTGTDAPLAAPAPTTATTSPVGVALGATDGGDRPKDPPATPPASNKNVDEYLECKEYRGHEEVEPGVTAFEKDGEYYFAFVREDGSVRLRSEGYPTTGARDNGIQSVKKNMDDEKRYQTRQTKNGRWYLSLTAGNNQEIARTCTSGSRAEALAGKPGSGASKKAAAPKPEPAAPLAAAAPAVTATNRQIDEYLPCKAYAGPADEGETHVRTFKQDDEYYFAILNDTGGVRLRSEGYPTTGARKNGLASVMKHLETRKRYQVRQTKKGKWYLMLTATNNQEIARTCEVGSRDEAKALLPAAPAPKAEPVAAPLAAAAPVAAPKPAPKAAARTSNRNIEEYLPCKAYAGHEESPAENFRTFKGEDDMYYFAVLNDDGTVFLRSESYPSRSARDNGVRSVQKHMNTDKQYKLRQSRKGKWYLILLASNNQEIARTCEQKDRAAAKALRPGAFAKPPKKAAAATGIAAAAALAAAAPKPEPKPEPVAAVPPPPPAPEPEPEQDDAGLAVGGAALAAGLGLAATTPEPEPKPTPEPVIPKTPEEREDDYLPCKQYARRKVNDKRNNVAFFKHKNGKYYFAIYHKNGRVRLRSEGFLTAKERDQELSGALRHLDNEEYYTEYRKRDYTIRILHDETGREVGRSCAEKDKAAVVPPVAAAAATAAAAVVAAPVVTAAATPPPPPPKATPVPPPPATTKKGGFPWWLLALLALLLLLLLFWCGGCGDALGCGGATVGDDDAVTTTGVVTPPADVEAASGEVEADAAAAAAAAAAEAEAKAAADAAAAAAANATCNCNSLTHPTFDLPSGANAKVLTRLGTNPEFGDSHSLTPAQFFQKLQRRYNASSVDKRYLDGVYRAMGYSNGFAGAAADQFTSTKLRRGQRGNMGYGTDHGTVYAQINVSDRDLQAFKIKAANGCDLHFMKTCGNHFFFCPN